MANHKSAIKRANQSRSRRMQNMGYKTRVKNTVKEVRAAVDNKNPQDQVIEGFKKSVSIIQKTASKGVIHKRKASRKISRLARLVNQYKSSSTVASTNS